MAAPRLSSRMGFLDFMEDNGGHGYVDLEGERSYVVPVPGYGRLYCVEYLGTIDDPDGAYYLCSCFSGRRNPDALGFETAIWQTRGARFYAVAKKALELMEGAAAAELTGRCETWTLSGSSWAVGRPEHGRITHCKASREPATGTFRRNV